MSAIRVLEVIRQGQIGGGESHLLDLIDGFGPTVNPLVLAFTPGHMIDLLTARGVECTVIETGKAFDPKVIRDINQLIRDEKIELIHAHGSRAASNMLVSAWQSHLPLVYTVHGWSFHQDQSKLIHSLRKYSEKVICSRSQQVICVSESNRVTGVEEFGLKNAMVIENGVNLNKFLPHPERTKIRSEFGFSDDDFVAGFIGRMTIQKDPINYLKAIGLAHQKDPRVKGLLIGDGDMKAETDAFIQSNQMASFVRTDGFRTDVPELLNAIDVFCLPSLWEGLSIALLEAMASARPVVVTPTDGAKEIIQDQHNGCIIGFNEPQALAAQLQLLLNDEKLRQKLGANARQLILDRFDSSQVSRQVEKLYQEITAKWKK